METGVEWIVDGADCPPDLLRGERGRATLQELFDELVRTQALHPVAPAQWHVFPGEAGVTGLLMLSESHLTCHSYPEHGRLSLNLYTCRPRRDPDWQRIVGERFPGARIDVRRVPRGRRAAVEAEGHGA